MNTPGAPFWKSFGCRGKPDSLFFLARETGFTRASPLGVTKDRFCEPGTFRGASGGHFWSHVYRIVVIARVLGLIILVLPCRRRAHFHISTFWLQRRHLGVVGGQPEVIFNIPKSPFWKSFGCRGKPETLFFLCLLYTSDAADD